jgi:uncharacterized protein YciI
MAYMIHTVDKADSAELRAKLRADHVRYLDENIGVLLAAGALLNDDGSGGNGSLLIVDTDDRKVAEALIAGDPFNRGGVFEKITVMRWRKGYFDKKKLI